MGHLAGAAAADVDACGTGHPVAAEGALGVDAAVDDV